MAKSIQRSSSQAVQPKYGIECIEVPFSFNKCSLEWLHFTMAQQLNVKI